MNRELARMSSRDIVALACACAAVAIGFSCAREGDVSPAPPKTAAGELDEVLSRYRAPANPSSQTMDPVLERIEALLALRRSSKAGERPTGDRETSTPGPPPVVGPGQAAPRSEPPPPAVGHVRLGPLDEIDIAVGGQPEFSGRVVVRQDGTLALPTTGDLVQAAGKTLEELAAAVADALSPRYLKKRPVVSAVLRRSPRLVYHVFGAVRRPGRYEMPPEGLSVLDAVLRASHAAGSAADGGSLGFEPVAGARYERVYVVGPGEGELRVVDLASAMRGGPERQETIRAGCVVLVPASSGTWEEGEIRRRLRRGEPGGDR